MGLGFWAILGFVTLLGYLFLVGIVSSVVFLDNVLPRIPNQTEISTRTRARDVNFTSGISKLSDPISGEVENFETLILQFSSKTRAGRIENIRELYNLGDFVGAISMAAAIVNVEPGNTEAIRLLGRTLDRIEEFGRAVVVWDHLQDLSKTDEESGMRSIRIRYNRKQYEQCIEACKKSLDSKINEELAYKMMGKSLLNLKRSEDALDIFKVLEQISPDLETQSSIERILFTLERFEQLRTRIIARGGHGENLLTDLRLLARVEGRLKHEKLADTLEQISRLTGDVDDWYEVARVRFNLKQYPESISATNEAINLDSEHEKSLILRIRALILDGQHSVALDEMNHLDQKGELGEKLSIRRAEICLNLGYIQEAASSYRKIWDSTRSVISFRGLVRCLEKEERYEDVLQLIDSVSDIDNEVVVQNKLRSLQKLSRWKELIQCFEERRGLVEKYPRILHFAAIAERDTGNANKAIELWKEMLILEPRDVDVNYLIAATSYDIKQNLVAKKYVDIVLEIDPKHEKAMWLDSQICVRNEEWEAAFSRLNELYSMRPLVVKYWRSHIENLYRLNRKNEAAQIFENAIEDVKQHVKYIPEFIFLAEEFLWSEKARELCEIFLKSSDDLSTALLELIDGYYSIGRAGSASRYAVRLRQRNGELFTRSIEVSRLMNLLEWADVTLFDCGGDPFWGQWKNEVYNTELVAKAIVERTDEVIRKKTNTRKIGMVSSTIGRGGAERQMMFCLNQLQGDDSILYDLDLFLHRDSSRDPDKTYLGDLNTDGLEIRDYGLSRMMNFQEHPLYHELEPWIELISHLPGISQNQRNLVSLFYQFVEGDYDLIHAWQDLTNVVVSMAALMAGVPRILLSARSLSPDTKTMLHMRKAGYLRGAYLHLLNSKSVVLCHNSEAGAQSYRNWLKCENYYFPVLHNGTAFDELITDLEEDENQLLNEFIQWKGDRITIGSVFRFVPEKQPLLWVEVAHNLINSRQDVCFLMVGDGALFDEVVEKVDQLGISEYFFFPGLSNSVGNWLEEMDLFLLTSRIEGLPNVIIEAQGFGLPVISTNAGGAAEVMIPNLTGRVSAKSQAPDIARVLLESIDDREWLNNASMVSRTHAREKFSVKGMYTRLLGLYDEFD